MYVIAFFGLIMVFVCCLMVINPMKFSQGIITFSNKSWFHWFEVISRLAIGSLLIVFCGSTKSPALFNYLGYGFIAVGFGLLFIGPEKHRNFANWSAVKLQDKYRAIGILSIPLGILWIYLAIV